MKKLIAIMVCSVAGIAAEGAAEFDSRMAKAFGEAVREALGL